MDVNASEALATLESPADSTQGQRTGPGHPAGPVRGAQPRVPGGRAGGRRAGGGRALPGSGGLRGPDRAAGRRAGGAGHRGGVRLLRAEQASRAVGGRGRRLGPRGAAARHQPRAPGRAAAARHDPGRGDAGRRVGHRHLRHAPGGAHPGGARGAAGAHRVVGPVRAPPIPPWPWPAWSPTGSGRRPRAGWCSSAWRTRPGC